MCCRPSHVSALLAAGLLALFGMPNTSMAAESAWQEVAPGVRLRLVSSDTVLPAPGSVGTTMAALEIDMPAGTKTYWRVPGETGIPMQLALEGSSGIAGHRMLWPYPEIDTTTGYVDFVYAGHTVLPFELTLAHAPAHLEAQVVIGICDEICVPVMTSFSLPLQFDRPDSANALRIAQAIAETPLPWTGATDAVPSVGYDAGAHALAIRYDPAVVDPLSFIADASSAGQLFGAPQKSPDENLVHLPLLGGAKAAVAGTFAIQLLFMTASGPYEVTREIVIAPSTAPAK